MEPISLGLGLLRGGQKIVQAFGQHQQAQNLYRDQLRVARQRNRQTVANYSYRIDEYIGGMNRSVDIFNREAQNLQSRVAARRDAVQRGNEAEQRRLNEIFAGSAFRDQAQLVNLMETLGMASASGMTGRSAERVDRMQMAQRGRNMAMQADMLTRARRSAIAANEERRQIAMAENRADAGQLMAPMFSNAPVLPQLQSMPTSPSNMGLYMGIAKAGIGSLSTMAQAEGFTNGKGLFGMNEKFWNAFGSLG
tara:strand:- start:495 stop:1247 length:753 start_codon:yes stop_codon:yes gene_type:complete